VSEDPTQPGDQDNIVEADAATTSEAFKDALDKLRLNVLETMWTTPVAIKGLLRNAELNPSPYSLPDGSSPRELWSNLIPVLRSMRVLATVLRQVSKDLEETSWQEQVYFLIKVLEDENRASADDDRRGRARTSRDSAWTLLDKAPEHLRTLLRSSHPSRARMAGLDSWIQECTTAIQEAEKSGKQIAETDEAAHVANVAEHLEAVLDAFQMYARMLETSRGASRAVAGQPRQARPLAAVAEDERTLLSCRADLRESLKELIASLEGG
jgi:hypothetical protein